MSKRERKQLKPGSREWLIVQEVQAELDAEYFPEEAEPKDYRIIHDANGYPMPVYNAPAIRKA